MSSFGTLDTWLILVSLLLLLRHDSLYLFNIEEAPESISSNELCIGYHLNQNFSYNRHVFVSYYYPVLKGRLRHPLSEYRTRIERYFNIVKIPTILFTQKRYLRLLNITIVPSNIIINEKYDSPYEICNLFKYREKYLKIASVMSKTENYVVTDVFGAIWNLKVCLVKEVLEKNLNYQYGHWIDIGMFKTDQYNSLNLSYTKRMDNIFNSIQDKILFGAIYSPKNFKIVPIAKYNIRKADYFIGSYFSGSRDAINNFYTEFFRLHDYFISKYQYVCRDEFIYSAYCIYHPHKCSFIHMKGNQCYSWHSTVGFLFESNPCKFPSRINYFNHTIKNGSKFLFEFSKPILDF